MPSIRSQLFNRFAGKTMKAMFSDFDVDRLRKQFDRIDKLSPAPRGVEIQPQALSECEAEWVRPRTETDRVVLYLPGGA